MGLVEDESHFVGIVEFILGVSPEMWGNCKRRETERGNGKWKPKVENGNDRQNSTRTVQTTVHAWNDHVSLK